MEHLDLRVGARRFLVCAPHLTGRGKPTGYGALVRQVHQAIRLAAQLGASVHLVRPRQPLNRALFDLVSDDVRIMRGLSTAGLVLRVLWRLSGPVRYGAPGSWLLATAATGSRSAVHLLMLAARRAGWRAADRRLDRAEKRLRRASDAHERRSADAWQRLLAEGRERVRHVPGKRVPMRLRLDDRADDAARRLLEGAGLDPAKPIVTLHVRESGYRRRGSLRQQTVDSLRDASIANYRPAIEWLVARGMQVVRIGDRTMTPCEWPGVVDVATAPWRTDDVEMWAVLRSRFFIASDSGPFFLAKLAGIPCVTVNAIQVGYYTLDRVDRYICKHVIDRASGHHLSVSEMLTEAFILSGLDITRYEWVENSPDDILEAVQDLVALVEDPERARTREQAAHDDLAEQVARRLPATRPDEGLLLRRPGAGSIAPRFAERYFMPRGVPLP